MSTITQMSSPLPRMADTPVDPGFMNLSAVSWGAILLGAVGAAGLSLILLILGSGLGLLSVSPWAGRGASAAAVGVAAIVWLSFTQFASSSVGGYLAGRLRTRWVGTHADEVYFRDTAHGLTAWAVATLATVALLTTTLGSIIGTGARVGASAAGGAATTAAGMLAAEAGTPGRDNTLDYYVDSLLRQPANAMAATAPTPASNSTRQGTAVTAAAPVDSSRNATLELNRIFAMAMRNGNLSQDDSAYAGQLVATRTGLSQADAEKRTADIFAKLKSARVQAEQAARDAADKARRASSMATLWLFVSLLLGAFVASYSATLGGRLRDR